MPRPKGKRTEGRNRLARVPRNRNNWLPESASEWKASASMAALPLIAAATNLTTAMPTLAARAITTTKRDSEEDTGAESTTGSRRGPGRRARIRSPAPALRRAAPCRPPPRSRRPRPLRAGTGRPPRLPGRSPGPPPPPRRRPGPPARATAALPVAGSSGTPTAGAKKRALTAPPERAKTMVPSQGACGQGGEVGGRRGHRRRRRHLEQQVAQGQAHQPRPVRRRQAAHLGSGHGRLLHLARQRHLDEHPIPFEAEGDLADAAGHPAGRPRAHGSPAPSPPPPGDGRRRGSPRPG